NWKMHKTVAEATALVQELLATDGLFSEDVEAIVCPPFTAIPAVSMLLGDQRKLGLGAQTDETVNLKVKAAIAFGLTPIVAVGETHGEHEAGAATRIVTDQVRGAF